jgi:phosphopantetheinyl transferase (holo-ACP synthase)
VNGPARRAARGIDAALESVDVGAAAAARETVLAQHFRQSEVEALAGRHVRSVAGWLAAKRAVLALLGRLLPELRLTERDVVIARGPSGRPVVRRVAELSFQSDSSRIRDFRISLSISHTRARAWGLAVLDEAARGHRGDDAEARGRG